MTAQTQQILDDIDDELQQIVCDTIAKLNTIKVQNPFPTQTITFSPTAFKQFILPIINDSRGIPITSFTHKQYKLIYMNSVEVNRLFAPKYTMIFKGSNGRKISYCKSVRNILGNIEKEKFFEVALQFRFKMQTWNKLKERECLMDNSDLVNNPRTKIKKRKEVKLAPIPIVCQYIHELLIGVHQKESKLKLVGTIGTFNLLDRSLTSNECILNGFLGVDRISVAHEKVRHIHGIKDEMAEIEEYCNRLDDEKSEENGILLRLTIQNRRIERLVNGYETDQENEDDDEMPEWLQKRIDEAKQCQINTDEFHL